MFINLTPHAVVVYSDSDEIIVSVPPSGTVARLTEAVTPGQPLGDVPTTTVDLGHVDGLPEPVEGTTYVGSMPLLMGMRAAGIARSDLVYPFDQVRDGAGRIIGCRALARIA